MSAARFVLLALGGLAAACGDAERTFDVRARYLGPSAVQGAVRLDHERMPGYMEAMRMDVAVGDTTGLGALPDSAVVEVRIVVDARGRLLAGPFRRLPDATPLDLAPEMALPADSASGAP